jgi:hypothetical protein
MTRGNFDGPMMSKIKYAGVDPRVLRLKNGFLAGETRDLIPSIGSRVSNGRKWVFESKDGRSTANWHVLFFPLQSVKKALNQRQELTK